MTTEATIKTLGHVSQSLRSMNVPAAVMGGLALAAWKRIRATRDVDMLVDLGDMPIGDFIVRLEHDHIRLRNADMTIRLDDLELLQLSYEPPDTFLDIQVDLFLANAAYQKEALNRRVKLDAAELGVSIDVLSCEDVILFKLLAGRIIDRADAAEVLRANHASLDLDYLIDSVRRLDQQAALRETWNEALPNIPFPMGGPPA